MDEPTTPRRGLPMPPRVPCAAGDHCAIAASRLTEDAKRCEHFGAIRPVAPTSDDCEACRAVGHDPVALRVCLTCGHVGCCEDSPGRHALAHFEATGHPMICSYERLETWGWCYVHGRYFDPLPGPLPQRPYVWQAWLAKVFGRKSGVD